MILRTGTRLFSATLKAIQPRLEQLLHLLHSEYVGATVKV